MFFALTRKDLIQLLATTNSEHFELLIDNV